MLFLYCVVCEISMKSIQISQKIASVLAEIAPFSSLPKDKFSDFVNGHDVKAFIVRKGECIVSQGDECRRLVVLISGRIKVENVDSNGDSLLVGFVDTPELLAVYPMMSSDHSYQATFTAAEEVVYVTIGKESVLSIIRAFPELLFSFFDLSCKCIRCKEERLKVLSRKTIRGRLSEYLCNHEIEPRKAKVIHTQTQLADYVGVSRPALSTEVNKMEKEGLIVREKGGIVYFEESIRNIL